MLFKAVSIFLIKIILFGSKWTTEDYVEIAVIGYLTLMFIDNKKPN